MMRRLLVVAGVLLAFGYVTAAAMPSHPAPDLSHERSGPGRPEVLARPLPEWVVKRAASMPAFRPTVPDASAPLAYDQLVDDFEEPILDPFKWIPFDGDGEVNGEYYWAMSKCRASHGQKSLWAIGGGKDGQSLPCGSPYPPGAESHAILVLDLSGWTVPPTNLNLTFDVWLNTRTETSPGGVVGDGMFVRYTHITPEGQERSIVLKNLTSQFPPDWWKEESIDLRNACDVYNPTDCYDLAGQPRVLLEFLFVSKDEPDGELPEGAYIDWVWLHASDAPSATNTPTNTPEITPTATLTSTATVTVTSTVTVTPTTETPPPPVDTPTPTATEPTPGVPIFLPVTYNQHEIVAPVLADHRRRAIR